MLRFYCYYYSKAYRHSGFALTFHVDIAIGRDYYARVVDAMFIHKVSNQPATLKGELVAQPVIAAGHINAELRNALRIVSEELGQLFKLHLRHGQYLVTCLIEVHRRQRHRLIH